MNAEQFTFWLHGFTCQKPGLNPEETQILKEKLSAIFTKVTPTYGNRIDLVRKNVKC
jgi:hypothetical protein